MSGHEACVAWVAMCARTACNSTCIFEQSEASEEAVGHHQSSSPSVQDPSLSQQHSVLPLHGPSGLGTTSLSPFSSVCFLWLVAAVLPVSGFALLSLCSRTNTLCECLRTGLPCFISIDARGMLGTECAHSIFVCSELENTHGRTLHTRYQTRARDECETVERAAEYRETHMDRPTVRRSPLVQRPHLSPLCPPLASHSRFPSLLCYSSTPSSLPCPENSSASSCQH